MNRMISRRHLLKGLVAAASGLGLQKLAKGLGFKVLAQTPDEFVYLPIILKGATPAPTPTPTATATNTPTATPTSTPSTSKVVHVHSQDATYWDFSTGWYGNYVRQSVVDAMVERGLMELTGASSVQAAWGQLLPHYQSGQAIAIKVNFNNAWSCDDSDNAIDALIHPVNAVVRGLKQIGVAEEDIWVYEAMRQIPNRFVNGCLYPNVQFFADSCAQYPGWNSSDPNAFVTFSPPSGPTPSSERVPDVLINATYLINMPIMKTHGGAGVTLSFKNHIGTIRRATALLHDYIFPDRSYFSTEYSPLVDIYQNPHVGAKTILTIGDGLFGAWAGLAAPPLRWTTFGDAASNSLFFATDPVAIDCVMYDFLAAETTIPQANADSYLSLAADAGLGVFEHGDPWGSGYSQIDYVKIET